MKECGIIMSAPMVRALLDVSKTQTRRVLARNIIHKVPNPPIGAQYYVKEAETFINRNPNAGVERKGGMFAFYRKPKGFYGVHFSCPYGVAGDRLWVRETWRQGTPMLNGPDLNGEVVYRADHPNSNAKWKPSIFMPRWASRITLEITRVRVERLQNISEEDAVSEGIQLENRVSHWAGEMSGTAKVMHGSAIRAYAWLWDSLHGKGAWEKNPWVWVLEFKRA